MSLPWKLTHQQWGPKSEGSASTVRHVQPYYQPHFITRRPRYYGAPERGFPNWAPDPPSVPRINHRGQQMIKRNYRHFGEIENRSSGSCQKIVLKE